MHYVALAGRVLFGVVFLVSGWTKVREPREFARSVRELGLVAPSWAGRVAATVAVLDNAARSHDSRALGPLPATALVGLVLRPVGAVRLPGPVVGN